MFPTEKKLKTKQKKTKQYGTVKPSQIFKRKCNGIHWNFTHAKKYMAT